jgi:DNA-directed RNA polymerase specialized sigma24 family protein
MPLLYDAFCRDRWRVYSRYATAYVGSARIGSELAHDSLRDLAFGWADALRSPSPAAVAWDLLTARTRTRPTEAVRCLHSLVHHSEAQALLLRYKLGLSAAEAADVMGLGMSEFHLLQKRALGKCLPSRGR